MDEALSYTNNIPRLRHALVRVGEPVLQRYVGSSVVKFADLLGESVSALRLADVLIERFGPQRLLETQVELVRDMFDALSADEAANLAQRFAGADVATPWNTLRQLSLPPTLENLRILCEFFGIIFAYAVAEEPLPPTLQDVCGSYPMYDYQSRTIARAQVALVTGDRRALIHMPTGSGKTRLAMALIARILTGSEGAAVVVWLAHSEELCDQAAEEFAKCWNSVGDRHLTVGRFYGSHELDVGEFKDGLLVAGLVKLYSRSTNIQTALYQLKIRTALVVMDEAHQAIAPTYKQLLQNLAPFGGRASLLGLSATPGRSYTDMGQDEELANFFSRTKIVLSTPDGLNPVEYLQRERYLAVPEYKLIPYTPSVTLSEGDKRALAQGLDITADTLRKLGDEATRNILLIREIANCAAIGGKIIVFACSVQHAVMLADSLTIKGIRAAALSATTPAERRRLLLRDFRSGQESSLQVMVNFAILTTGFDAPKTNVVVVARPTQSVVLYSQMIGRAMRGPRANGNSTCTVVTVQDQIPGFRSIYESFFHWEDVW
jgi:DNA repair protein RadD